MSREEEKEVSMERNITLSPEALPYWNMIKDASPKVRDELKVFLINVSVSGAMKSYEENTEKEHLGKYDTDPDTIAFLNDFAGAWSDMPGTTEEIIDSCESCRTMSSREQRLEELWG